MKKLFLISATAMLLASCGGPSTPASSATSGGGSTPTPTTSEAPITPISPSTPTPTSSSGPITDAVTVTFESNGGSAVASVEVQRGTPVAKPADPTKLGAYFTGWYGDQWLTGLYNFELPVGGNLTLYAGWSDTPVDTAPFSGNEFYLYTVSGMPDWVTNNDCVIFAWTWSSDDLGSWSPLTFTSKTSATFEVAYELYGFLLARCAAETTMPDWSITDDRPGRVYNQCNDIDCTSGKYEYTCPSDSWMEYPKKQ